ncbi:hypothetical protein GBA52_001783 [Prunus armeniaca]|nr:hypothetical protein GBA52_001783 [Prunus armeniaca]
MGYVGRCMPTLKTSAFLFDHHNQHQQQLVGSMPTIRAELTTTFIGLSPALFGPTEPTCVHHHLPPNKRHGSESEALARPNLIQLIVN